MRGKCEEEVAGADIASAGAREEDRIGEFGTEVFLVILRGSAQGFSKEGKKVYCFE